MAVSQNSTFNFTDTDVTPFVVKPFTANGPQTPASATMYTNPDGVSAISANTSLVLVGRGTPYYGEVVQANMVYMLEHFSNKTRPMFPTMGQIWYKKQNFTDSKFPSDPTGKGLYLWNGVSWDPIQVKGATAAADQDLGGFRIINLGDPQLSTDAVNLRAADTRYVRTTGADIAGSFFLLNGTFHADTGAKISCDDMPTDPPHVVNLAYLTLVSNALSADISSVGQRIDNLQTNGGVYAPTTGATFSGNVVLTSTATLVAQSGGAAFSLGGRMISDIALTPSDPADAASKQYVDDSITTVNTSIALTNSNLSALQTSLPTTYLTTSGGTFSGDITIGTTANFTLMGGTGTVDFGARRIQNVSDPSAASDAATRGYVDSSLTNRKIRRWVYTSDGTTTLVTIPPMMRYVVGSNRLQVFHSGAKWVANTNGTASVKFTGTGLSADADTTLAASTTYTVNITVDTGTATPLSVTTGAGTTSFAALVNLLNAAAIAGSINVVFTLEPYYTTEMQIIATSLTSGSSSAVTLGYVAGSTFYVIPGSTTPVSVPGAVYNYAETGNLNTLSTQVTLTTAPANGDVIEFVWVQF